MAFFQASGRSREPIFNAPPVVVWLIGAVVAAYLLRAAASDLVNERILFALAFIPAQFSSGLVGGISLGGLVSLLLPIPGHLFVHGSFSHVALNCLWLLAFGPGVARRLGPARFLAFFFLCGAAAALAHLVLYWGATELLIGASGAVAGLMAAGMRILYGSRTIPYVPYPPLAPIRAKPILFFAASWVGVNILFAFTSLGLSDAPIAWAAHLGGFIMGLVSIDAFDQHAKETVPRG